MKNNKSKNTFGIKAKLLRGSNWLITIAAVIAVVVDVNLLVGLATDKFNMKIDISHNRVLTLTNTTKDLLHSLNKDIQLVVFEDKDSQHPYIEPILNRYKSESSHIKIIKVDAVSNPGAVKKYGFEPEEIMLNSIIVSNGECHKIIQTYELFPYDSNLELDGTINAEGVITAAINYVIDAEPMKIGVVRGHDELEFLNSNMGSVLKQQYIEYKDVELYTQKIPDDVNYLVICGPKKDFSDGEIEKLDAYLSSGKSVQLMLSSMAPSLPNLESYLSEWGIKVNDDTIIENNPSYVFNSDNSLVWVVGDTHPITSGLSQIVVPYPKSIEVNRDVNLENLNVSTLFTTSKQASSIDNKTGKSTDGEYDLAILSENTSTDSSILVVSSHTIYKPEYFNYNSELFTNAMMYQTEKELPIIIQPKSMLPPKLTMSASDIRMVRVIVVFLIPFAILLLGFIVWLRRRHL